MMRIIVMMVGLFVALAAKADEYRVTANVLNVRALPLTDASVVGQVRRGDMLETTAGSIVSGPDWIGIRLPSGESGFVSSRFVERVRIDRFNADFLQVLPETPADFIAGLVENGHMYGLRDQQRFAISSSGRYLVSFDRAAFELEIFDTQLGRMTRRIATQDFALTDNFLVYVPRDGMTSFPHLEYIDLSVSDTVRRLDPQVLGLDEFRGLAAIPFSDRVITQVKEGSRYRVVALDLRRQQVDRVFVEDARDASGSAGIEFFSIDPQTILGVRTPLNHGSDSGVVYAIEHGSGRVTVTDVGPLTITQLLDAAFFPDEGLVVIQGPSSDGAFGQRANAVDYRNGTARWTHFASEAHGYLKVDPSGSLVSYTGFGRDRVVVYHDPLTGQEVERVQQSPEYDQVKMVWTSASNDGAATLTLEAGVRIGRLQTPITTTIDRAGERRVDVLPAAVRNMFDLGPDGRTLRLLVTEGDAQALYEWPLAAPEPSVAQSVDPGLRWVSTPSQRDTYGVVFNTEPGPRSRIGWSVTDSNGLLAPIEDGTAYDCDSMTGLGRIARAGTLASDSGRFSQPSSLVCLLSWDATRGLLQDRVSPSGVIPQEEISRFPGCDLRALSCLDYLFGQHPRKFRLDASGDRFWTIYSTPADTRAEQETVAEVITYAADGTASRGEAFGFREVYSFFDTQSDDWLVRPPLADAVASDDGVIRMFVTGLRRGEDDASTWLFEIGLEGELIAAPRRVPDLDTGERVRGRAYANAERFVFFAEDRLTILSQDLEIIASRPHQSLGYGPGFDLDRAQIGRDHFVVSLSSNIYEVYRLSDAERAATFVVDAHGNALAMTDGGYFAQNGRAAAEMLILRNRDTGEALPISSVFDTLYRPDLVREALIGDPDNRVGNAERTLSLESVMLSGGAPVVETVEAEPDVVSDAVTARMVAQLGSGGIGSVIWRVNGVVVGVDESLSAPFENDSGTRVEAIRLLPLEPGENTITAQVTNHTGTILSDLGSVQVTRAAGGDVTEPRLFVMAVGVNDYVEERLRLNYAVNDARAVTDMLSRSGGDFDDVRITTVFDRDVSREALDAAFGAIAADIRPSDTFVFFLAGHGVTHDGRYYFLPPDIDVTGDPGAALAQQGISQTDWRRYFSRIPALRSVILFDSCESGSAIRMNAVNEFEQEAGISRLAEASGRAIITAAAETQYALEGHNGHGAFTYTVLQAFEQGDLNSDDRLDLAELASFVELGLPSLTERVWQYRQEPSIHIFGSVFDIGDIGS